MAQTNEKQKVSPVDLLMNSFTGLLNLNYLPALSLPIGKSKEGLPIGAQLIGKAYDEANLYKFAVSFEKERNIYENK